MIRVQGEHVCMCWGSYTIITSQHLVHHLPCDLNKVMIFLFFFCSRKGWRPWFCFRASHWFHLQIMNVLEWHLAWSSSMIFVWSVSNWKFRVRVVDSFSRFLLLPTPPPRTGSRLGRARSLSMAPRQQGSKFSKFLII